MMVETTFAAVETPSACRRGNPSRCRPYWASIQMTGTSAMTMAGRVTKSIGTPISAPAAVGAMVIWYAREQVIGNLQPVPLYIQYQ
jgi:hypothetical protein